VRTAAGFERPHFEPVLVYAATPGRGVVRSGILVLLALAPLAIGCAYPPAYIPLLIGVYGAGAYTLYRGYSQRASGVVMAEVPGVRFLIAIMAIVLFQLLPLPPRLLSWVSPGSFAFYNDVALMPLGAWQWRPITASPADTARGLLFLVGMTFLYVSVYREFDHPAWRRRLAKTVVLAGFVMTIEALVQQAYTANLIYGLYQPRWDWAVFGPYVNRNLFAGYMLMAVPLGVGLTAGALDDLRRAWSRRRRHGWLALGDSEGSAFLLWGAVAMALVVGLWATHSRGAMLGLAVWAITAPFFARRRILTGLVVVLVVGLGVAWLGLDTNLASFQGRGVLDGPRLLIWGDSLRLARLHPILGSGFNAFGSALPPRQTVLRSEWIGTTHNDYLQVLVDLGVVGTAFAGVLLFMLLRNGVKMARQGAFQAGLFGSIVAVLAHNVVDCNWQIPANAVTFAAVAALVMQPLSPSPFPGRDPRTRGRRDSSP
jgi:O-antigen ligase